MWNICPLYDARPASSPTGAVFSPYEIPKELGIFHKITRQVRAQVYGHFFGWRALSDVCVNAQHPLKLVSNRFPCDAHHAHISAAALRTSRSWKLWGESRPTRNCSSENTRRRWQPKTSTTTSGTSLSLTRLVRFLLDATVFSWVFLVAASIGAGEGDALQQNPSDLNRIRPESPVIHVVERRVYHCQSVVRWRAGKALSKFTRPRCAK